MLDRDTVDQLCIDRGKEIDRLRAELEFMASTEKGKLRATNAKLLAALQGLLEDVCELLNSGDIGFTVPVEEMKLVIQARAAIEEAKERPR